MRALHQDVTVVVESDVHLESPFWLVNVSNVNITGALVGRPQVHCVQEGAGFLLLRVRRFNLANLVIQNCTMEYNISGESYHFAMLISESSDFVLRMVRFENCSQTALLLANNAAEARIENSTFANSKFLQLVGQKYTLYSGAINILEKSTDSAKIVNYLIDYTLFCGNNVSTVIKIPTSTEKLGFDKRGYGGGVFVEFSGNTTNSTVTISHSNFTKNEAVRGGGVYAYYAQKASGNSINIT